jgi:hypothetical protein
MTASGAERSARQPVREEQGMRATAPDVDGVGEPQASAWRKPVGRKGETLFFVGQARLPESLASRETGNVLVLELEVDATTFTIVNLACAQLSPLSERFLVDLLVGHSLQDSIAGPVREIEQRYFGAAQKAILSALENAYERYWRYRTGQMELLRART